MPPSLRRQTDAARDLQACPHGDFMRITTLPATPLRAEASTLLTCEDAASTKPVTLSQRHTPSAVFRNARACEASHPASVPRAQRIHGMRGRMLSPDS